MKHSQKFPGGPYHHLYLWKNSRVQISEQFPVHKFIPEALVRKIKSELTGSFGIAMILGIFMIFSTGGCYKFRIRRLMDFMIPRVNFYMIFMDFYNPSMDFIRFLGILEFLAGGTVTNYLINNGFTCTVHPTWGENP